jgi:hypothetical protein
MNGRWTRETPWQQGSAIAPSTCISQGLFDPEHEDTHIAIVITHDCDLVEDNLVNEPNGEVIIGMCVNEANPNLACAKSPNRLHLEVIWNGQAKFAELKAVEKRQINKSMRILKAS